MKQETKEYIDNEVNNLATVLRKEVSDIAQGIHERIGAVQQELADVKHHTDDHCRLGAHNSDIANAVFEDIDRRLAVLDTLAGISSESPQLDAELSELNQRFDAATARANSPLGSLLDFLTNGPGPSGGPSILGGIFGS
jgi:uncharacterized phage infection (PIP) family protein YhgE